MPTNNSSHLGLDNYYFQEGGKFAKTFVYCLLFVVSLVGNSLIIWAIFRDKRLKTTNNFLVANMAVGYILSTIVSVPLSIVEIHFNDKWMVNGALGDVLCKIVISISDISTSVSFYSCLFIAVDRYYAVFRPTKRGFSQSKLQFIVPGIWIFSVLIISPYFYFMSIETNKDFTSCSYKDSYYEKVHFYALIVLNIGIPFPIIAAIYSLIVCKLRRHRQPGEQISISRKARDRCYRRVLHISVMTVTLLCFSWMFFSVVASLIMERVITDNRASWVFAAKFLGRSSFAHNFFIHLAFNSAYRQNFKAIMKTCCTCAYRR